MSKAARLLCIIFSAVFILLTVVGVSVNQVVYGNAINEIVDDEYVNEVHGFIAEELEASAHYFEIPAEYFTDYIDDKEIRRTSSAYYTSLHRAICNGYEMGEITFSSDMYLKGIEAFANTLEDKELVFDREAATLIADEVAAISASCITAVDSKYVSLVSKLSTNETFKMLVTNWYVYGLLAAFFAALSLVIPGVTFRRRLSFMSAGVSVPCGFTLLLLTLLKGYDFKGKLSVAESSMKLMLDSLIDRAFKESITLAGILTAFSLIALSVAIILRIRQRDY